MWRVLSSIRAAGAVGRRTSKFVQSRLVAVKREIASTEAQRRQLRQRDSGISNSYLAEENQLRRSPERVQRLRDGLIRWDQSTWHGLPTLRVFVASMVAGIVILYVYRDEVRNYFATEVAGVANRSMEHEELIRRAGVLATSVVADQAVRDQTIVLLKASVQALLADEELRKQMLGYLAELIRDESTQKSVADCLYDLVQQPYVQQFMSEFFVAALQSQSVTDQVNVVAKDATQEVLADELVRMMASDALWDVVRGTVWKRAEAKPDSKPDSKPEAKPEAKPETSKDK